MSAPAESFEIPGATVLGAHAGSRGHVVLTKTDRRWPFIANPGADAATPETARPSLAAGGVLIAGACILLAVLAVAMGITSFHAQFAFIVAIKHERLPSMLEALGLDCGAVTFSLLGISLASLGRRALVERVLVLACALGSCGMNALNANLGSPRSVAVWALPPALFALTSDRLVAVIRRAALGRLADDESQRSAWRLFGTAFLYGARLAVAPRSTASGARQALLNATPLPGAAPAALAASPTRKLRGQHAGGKALGPTKTGRLLSLAAERHDLAAIPLADVSSIATRIASEIDLHPGTARRVLLGHVRELQSGGAE